MKHKILFIFTLLLTPLASSAFTVTNNTDYELRVEFSASDWWFTTNYTIAPKKKNVAITEGIKPNTSLDYFFSVFEAKTGKKISTDWSIHWHENSNFELTNSNSSPVLYVDNIPIA